MTYLPDVLNVVVNIGLCREIQDIKRFQKSRRREKDKMEKKKVWEIIISLLLGILVYAVIGTIITALGTNIYNNLPTQNISFSEYKSYNMIIKNSAPLSLPFVTPSFSGWINITEKSGNVTCLVDTSRGELPCENNSIDLGAIPAGKDEQMKFWISSNKNNFTIRTEADIMFIFINIKAKSKTMKCIYNGDGLYSCN
jgi:hypothetical protein